MKRPAAGPSALQRADDPHENVGKDTVEVTKASNCRNAQQKGCQIAHMPDFSRQSDRPRSHSAW